MGASRLQMRNELRELKYQMTEMVSKMSSMDVQLELYKSRLHACEHEVIQRREDCMSLRRALRQTRQDLFYRDQCSLRNHVNMINVPEDPSISLIKLVVKVARMFEVPLEERDIVWAERVGHVRTRNELRPIIVCLVNNAHRLQLMYASRIKRQIMNTEVAIVPLYVNERLHLRNHLLLQKTRNVGRCAGWHQVWSADGKIYVRFTPSTQKKLQIRNFRDLFEFCTGSSQLRSIFFRDAEDYNDSDSN